MRSRPGIICGAPGGELSQLDGTSPVPAAVSTHPGFSVRNSGAFPSPSRHYVFRARGDVCQLQCRRRRAATDLRSSRTDVLGRPRALLSMSAASPVNARKGRLRFHPLNGKRKCPVVVCATGCGFAPQRFQLVAPLTRPEQQARLLGGGRMVTHASVHPEFHADETLAGTDRFSLACWSPPPRPSAAGSG